MTDQERIADLAKRLRMYETSGCGDYDTGEWGYHPEICDEAADEIDGLQAGIACCNPSHLRVATKYQNGTENNDSPHAKNAQKTHCIHGHAFTPENTRMVTIKNPKNRYGKPISPRQTRVCLTCYRARRPGTRL
jgi:hypothetical protein